jgi:hypothetical protein
VLDEYGWPEDLPTMFFTLGEDGEPMPCRDPVEWVQWKIKAEGLHVGDDVVGEWWVSTVFLGMNVNPWGEPETFETMIFNRKDSDIIINCRWRYVTRSEAAIGHRTFLTVLSA